MRGARCPRYNDEVVLLIEESFLTVNESDSSKKRLQRALSRHLISVARPLDNSTKLSSHVAP